MLFTYKINQKNHNKKQIVVKIKLKNKIWHTM